MELLIMQFFPGTYLLIPLRPYLSQTAFSLCFSLNVIDQVSHPH